MRFESGLWFVEQFQIFKKILIFFYQNALLGPDVYAVTNSIVKRDCEEDADEAAEAESSIDEGDADLAKYTRSPTLPPPQTKILYETAYNTS